MKKLTAILLFLVFGIFGNAESVSSIIYKKLSAKGIKREIIEETIKLDEEIGDGMLFETSGIDGAEYLEKLENLLEKDRNNYIVAGKIAETYLASLYLKNIRNGKKYMDIFEKASPTDYEIWSMKVTYYGNIEGIDEKNKIINQINKKYPNSLFLKLIKLQEEANDNGVKNLKTEIDETLKLLSNKSETDKFTMSDEEIYSYKLSLHFLNIRNFVEKNEFQKGIDYYLNNIATLSASNEVKNYNFGQEKFLFMMITTINNNIENKSQKKRNVEKLKNTDIFRKIDRNREIEL